MIRLLFYLITFSCLEGGQGNSGVTWFSPPTFPPDRSRRCYFCGCIIELRLTLQHSSRYNKSTLRNTQSLKVYTNTQHTKFVNVDTTTPAGIDQAKSLGLVSSGVADVAFTSLIGYAGKMFNPPKERGRVFSVFRHPVERAASQFYHDQRVGTDPAVVDMTLVEYVMSGRVEGDWMTKALVGKPVGIPLSNDDLILAMEVIRRKILVGLSDRMEESLLRFQKYFGWDRTFASNRNILACQNGILSETGLQNPTVQKGSEGWGRIEAQNRNDVNLYEYALKLYTIQGQNL